MRYGGGMKWDRQSGNRANNKAAQGQLPLFQISLFRGFCFTVYLFWFLIRSRIFTV